MRTRLECFPCFDATRDISLKENEAACSGELVFVSNRMVDKRIRCECDGWLSKGGLNLTGGWYGWDVWRFSATGDSDGSVVIGSWTHPYYLCSNKEGEVYKSDDINSNAARWIVQKIPDSKTSAAAGAGVVLFSVENGGVLCVDQDRLCTVAVSDEQKKPYYLWELEPAHRNAFSLSSQGKRLCINDKKTDLVCTTDQPLSPENGWRIEIQKHGNAENHNDGDTVTIQRMADGKYLAAAKGDKIQVREEGFLWYIEQSRDGYCFSVPESGAYICCDNGQIKLSSNELTQEDDEDEDEEHSLKNCTWILEPHLPATKTSRERKMMQASIASAVAVTALAAPVAVMGAVGAAGFGSGGIAAGSYAAGMMSAEAIASGGAIAAGGTVATLQSIGAAGLGWLGITSSMTAGAVVGGTVGTTTTHVLNRTRTNVTHNSATVMYDGISVVGNRQKRPFANWRNW